MVTVEADVPGDELAYVVLDETVVVESDGDGELPDAVAGAFEGRLEPPYRAVGIRRGSTLWALGARRIETVELPEVAGDEIDLAVGEDGMTLLVDGARAFGTVPELEAVARERGLDHYVVHAERLDGDVWELRVASL